jgi:two-component system, cell cycle response regulator CtrA
MPILMVGRFSSSMRSQIRDPQDIIVCAEGSDEAIELLFLESYDLILVDMAAALREDGFDLIRRLRASENDTPVLALTGPHIHDQVEAIGLGADEALADPVDPIELRGRVEAIVQRHRGLGRPLRRVGKLELCLIKRKASFRGVPLNLTAREFSILELLVLREGSVLTKASFMDHLYTETDEPDGRIIDVFICKLRKELARVGSGPLISVVWGHGYKIQDVDAMRQPGGDILIAMSPDDRISVEAATPTTGAERCAGSFRSFRCRPGLCPMPCG